MTHLVRTCPRYQSENSKVVESHAMTARVSLSIYLFGEFATLPTSHQFHTQSATVQIPGSDQRVS